MPKVWWYGYGKKFQQQMEAMLQALFARGVGARLKGALGSAGALRRNRRI